MRGKGWIMDVGNGVTSRCRCWGVFDWAKKGERRGRRREKIMNRRGRTMSRSGDEGVEKGEREKGRGIMGVEEKLSGRAQS